MNDNKKKPMAAVVVVVVAFFMLVAVTTTTTTTAYAQLSSGSIQPTTSPSNTTTSSNSSTTNSSSNNSSNIATTTSETLWELEIRERRTAAGLPQIDTRIPNLTKSPESLEIDQLQAQDPKFANFQLILDQCYKTANGVPEDDVIPHSQCQARLEEASAAWCGVEIYDAKKLRRLLCYCPN